MRFYRPEGSSNYKFQGFKLGVLKKYMQEGRVIEGPVNKCDSDLNLYVDLGENIVGVIPQNEIEYNRFGKELKKNTVYNRVGKSTCFKVINIEELEDGSIKATLSRKQAQKECYDNFVSKLRPGQVIDACITHAEEYGAFCDIGCGLTALLPTEGFCVVKNRNPKSMMMKYRNIKAVVKSIDENGRIFLTHKELLGTWEEEASKYKPGDTAVGVVRLIQEYGIFVELTPNLAGLAEPIEGFAPGDLVNVFIKNIVPDKMKVKLLIIGQSTPTEGTHRLRYRVPRSGFVNRWVYSTPNSEKLIETVIEGAPTDEELGIKTEEVEDTTKTVDESEAIENTEQESTETTAEDVAEEAAEPVVESAADEAEVVDKE